MEKILDNNYYDLIISNLLVPSFGVSDDVTLLNDRFSLLHVAKKICSHVISDKILTMFFRPSIPLLLMSPLRRPAW